MKRIFFLLVIFIFVVGCEDNGPSVTSEDVYKGTTGMEISFQENKPPEESYVGRYFFMNLDVWNKGAYDVEDGYILINLDDTHMIVREEPRFGEPSSFNKLDESHISFQLFGRNTLNIQGEHDSFGLKIETPKILSLEEQDSSLSVSVCYPYHTIASPNVCIDTDPLGLREGGTRACEASDVSLSGGQGGPVGVKRVEVEMLPTTDERRVQPQFIIHIDNFGSGDVFAPEKANDVCYGKYNEDDLNKVLVTASLPDGKELDCDIESDEKTFLVDMESKEKFAICTLEEGFNIEGGSYTVPLNIRLDYSYRTTINHDITIKKLGR
ncbi:hypothetical protein ACFLZX_00290 [Nanoarchaeota archaeon]